jgi:hypothetical protein
LLPSSSDSGSDWLPKITTRHGRHTNRLSTPVPALFSNGLVPRWPDKAVMFDVLFTLNFKVGRSLRPLTELERKVVAQNIVDYLQLSNC